MIDQQTVRHTHTHTHAHTFVQSGKTRTIINGKHTQKKKYPHTDFVRPFNIKLPDWKSGNESWGQFGTALHFDNSHGVILRKYFRTPVIIKNT